MTVNDLIRVEPHDGDALWAGILGRPQLIVAVDFGVELLEACLKLPDGIQHFNRWCHAMADDANLLNPSGSNDDPDPLLVCGIQIIDTSLTSRDLRGIDLQWVYCERVCFDGSDLSPANPAAPLTHAALGACPFCSFRGCDLTGTHFTCDITGCDFTGRKGAGAMVFDHLCSYDPQHTPLGLPPEVLARLKQWPSEQPSDQPASPVWRPVKAEAALMLSPGGRQT